jgi:hypothetical protein
VIGTFGRHEMCRNATHLVVNQWEQTIARPCVARANGGKHSCDLGGRCVVHRGGPGKPRVIAAAIVVKCALSAQS